MIKQIVVVSLIIVIVVTQTTVNPKTQGCACSNLLNQADCQAQQGCSWTATQTNSTNSTASTNSTTTVSGTCNISLTSVVTFPTYCGLLNSTTCAQTVGCAWLNNTCSIFTGCTAYVNTTNALCQSISSQCTTDTTKCIPIAQCSTYTKSQQQCEGNVGSVPPYKCKWTASGTSGTCAELTCKDAPTTYTTLKQCQSWISNCLSTGAGCDTSLGTCSTYKVADNCVGRIGSDGNCGKPTDSTAVNCVALSCSDAPKTTAYNTDAACVAFQPIKTCVTTQKGCVDSPLPLCSTFKKTDTCTDFKGSDGWCTDDTTTATTTTCRALKCSDASFTTNDACKAAIKGLTCISNGLTCTDVLQNCEQYNDTNANCLNFVGLNGKCKGTSTTETAKASCAARVCREASITLKDDTSCNSYKTGCVTTGAGCTDTLQACNTYTGTATTCAQYKGSDGNCYAPSTQTTDGSCQAKVCADADKTFTQNSQCQSYSYLCYTNGQGCTALTSCDAALLPVTCSGNNSCSSVNNLCLGLSDCSNFKTQSQCLLNNQSYIPSGSTTTYSRRCQWSSGSCSNIACADIATKLSVTLADLKDDATCKAKLDGCVFGGASAGGCIDINDDCTKYIGTLTTCQNFKGSQGKDQCINTSSNASTPAPCVKKSCSSAKTQSTTSFTKQSDCVAFQATGCNFDGKDSCTDFDCTTYYATDCTTVTTAKDSSGKSLLCAKDATKSNNQCKNRTCADATPNGATLFNTDSLCNTWLTGCLTDGTKCVDPTTATCASYKGTVSQCNNLGLTYLTNTYLKSQCTKTTNLCQDFSSCDAHTVPLNLTTNSDKAANCQLYIQDGTNCSYNPTTGKCSTTTNCSQYLHNLTGNEAQQYCWSFYKQPGNFCWYTSGQTCSEIPDCTIFPIPAGSSDASAASYCQSYAINNSEYCGFIAGATKCSSRTCNDLIVASSASDCSGYLGKCSGYSSVIKCYEQKATCNLYSIDAAIYDTAFKKAQYCSSLADSTSINCNYDASTSTTNCSNTNTCALVTFANAAVSSLSSAQKQDFCKVTRKANGTICSLLQTDLTKCSDVQNNCALYKPIDPASGSATDDTKKASCLKFNDSVGLACSWTDGANCTTLTCSTVTDSALCSTYMQCFYNGISCIEIVQQCSGYTIPGGVTDKAAYCKQLTGFTDSIKCGYNATTSTTVCSPRTCGDLATSDSNQTCQNYLSSCYYDGSKCVDTITCSDFTAQGTLDTDKSNYCKQIADGSKCVFIVGSTKCTARDSCSNYTIPNLSFSKSQSACKLVDCGYSTGNSCEDRSCANAITASTDQECQSWGGCQIDYSSSCAPKNCNDAPTTANTNALCGQYRSGCVTTLSGCIESSATCDKYQGDATMCQQFTGAGIKCNNKNANPSKTDQCINKVCTDNTTALTNSDCDTWYPNLCIWNGTKGCWDKTKNCADFQGTVDSCKIYKASDGPCSGTGLGTTLAACYSNSVCTNAPTSIKTDADCKTWHSNCVTNGFGCIVKTSKCTDIVDVTVCAASSLGCSSTGNQCLTKPTSCSSFTTAYDCNNTLLSGQTSISCGWDSTKASSNCVSLTCELLPSSLTTDGQCAAKLTQGQCTTSGAGCVTKDNCSNYKTQAICQNAKSKDTQGSCTWENSSCRPIKCEDKTVGATDDICNTYLTGCRTNGVSCVTPSALTCSSLARAVCLKDGTGSPCYWFSGACLPYLACTSITQTTHQTCQSYSTFCTTDGTKCIAIDKCASLQKASCFVGTDNGSSVCGWGQTTGQTAAQCQVFTNCGAFNGTTNTDCSLWGSKCFTDGTKCIDQSACASYSTQTACGNLGTDGKCQWVVGTAANTGTCRLKQCSDATSADVQSLTSYAGCNSFIINSSTKCNTNGTGCVVLGTCASNSVQAGCQVGTDGDCFWATTNSTNTTSTQSCRLKTCTDLQLTTSAQCALAINKVDCVSDGTKCIPKAACSSYTTKEACSGKGTDGQCAFTPANSTSPTIGTCKAFSQCSDANSDSVACNSNPSCNFVTNGTSTTCSSHTCATKAQGSTCYPIPSFDLATYQICVLSGTVCAAGNANTLTSTLCYDKSVNTYTWNPTSQTCQACGNLNTINNTVNNTNTTNSLGYVLYLLVFTLGMI